MIKELFLLSGALASITTPEIIVPKVFECTQNGTYGEDYAVTNILGQYNGDVMSLDFNTITNNYYNPLRTNPYTNAEKFDFSFQFDLRNYYNLNSEWALFPYYIMSFNGGSEWQALPINENQNSFTIRGITYSELQDVRIMYRIQESPSRYFTLDNWKVTFWKPGSFIEYETDAYDLGYEEGYNIAWNGAKDYYYDIGYDAGHTAGYQEGATASLSETGIQAMLGSIIDYPVNLLRGLFNFELFGVNLFGILTFAATLALIVWIIKRFKK